MLGIINFKRLKAMSRVTKRKHRGKGPRLGTGNFEQRLNQAQQLAEKTQTMAEKLQQEKKLFEQAQQLKAWNVQLVSEAQQFPLPEVHLADLLAQNKFLSSQIIQLMKPTHEQLSTIRKFLLESSFTATKNSLNADPQNAQIITTLLTSAAVFDLYQRNPQFIPGLLHAFKSHGCVDTRLVERLYKPLSDYLIVLSQSQYLPRFNFVRACYSLALFMENFNINHTKIPYSLALALPSIQLSDFFS
ncbi:MAG: hypothetical protein K0U12_00655, partial [Gammaproteobacteria bacterium]|nr:hypothetical protein [Gammaproteobacteria bacterium]